MIGGVPDQAGMTARGEGLPVTRRLQYNCCPRAGPTLRHPVSERRERRRPKAQARGCAGQHRTAINKSTRLTDSAIRSASRSGSLNLNRPASYPQQGINISPICPAMRVSRLLQIESCFPVNRPKVLIVVQQLSSTAHWVISIPSVERIIHRLGGLLNSIGPQNPYCRPKAARIAF